MSMTICFAASSPLFFPQSRTRTRISSTTVSTPTRSCLSSNTTNSSSPDASPSRIVRVSRRRALFGLLAFGILSDAAKADDTDNSNNKIDTELLCKNCYGQGQITCELCGGSGFWKALMGNDENLRYKGVTCPECDGAGKTTCPVCLGTKEANVRGLLRRRTVEPGKGRILQTPQQ